MASEFGAPKNIRRRIAECAVAVEAGNTPQLPSGAGASERQRTLRIVDDLSTAVLRFWSNSDPAPTPGEMIALLNGFDRARRALRDDPNADSDSNSDSAAIKPDGAEFVMEFAHDLRSPLTSIIFLSETLRSGERGEVNETQRRQLGIIYSAALHLVSMASDVIEWVRDNGSLVEHGPTPFSVREMMDSIRSLLEPMAEERGLALEIQVEGPDRYLGYPVLLSRVLLNLMTNSLKYTDRGRVETSVHTTPTGGVLFCVRDTGKGISTVEAAHLYEPFHSTSSGRRYDISSSGLGLAICRKLVRAMGSELHYETSPEWGTRFFFELDIEASESA
jgi:signal transduction histidine kinase